MTIIQLLFEKNYHKFALKDEFYAIIHAIFNFTPINKMQDFNLFAMNDFS